MREYELRILKSDRTLDVSLSSPYFSDFAAIRAAQLMRRTGQMAEVWREDVCIFEESKISETSGTQRPAA